MPVHVEHHPFEQPALHGLGVHIVELLVEPLRLCAFEVPARVRVVGVGACGCVSTTDRIKIPPSTPYLVAHVDPKGAAMMRAHGDGPVVVHLASRPAPRATAGGRRHDGV